MTRVRDLGADGAMSIHPSHVPVINEIFSPSNEEVSDAIHLLQSIARSLEEGSAATRHGDFMVDYAHVRSAQELIARARRFGIEVDDVPAIEVPRL
jgi:citrate lyase subunit beta/citryl-CoA lyase